MEFPKWVMDAFPPPATQHTYLFRGKCPIENTILRAWFDNDLSTYAKFFFFSLVFYLICVAYRLKSSSLAKYPPRLWAASRFATVGDLRCKIPRLLKYGDVVRLAPDELSFISQAAQNESSAEVPSQPQLQKTQLDSEPPMSSVTGLGPCPHPDKNIPGIRSPMEP